MTVGITPKTLALTLLGDAAALDTGLVGLRLEALAAALDRAPNLEIAPA